MKKTTFFLLFWFMTGMALAQTPGSENTPPPPMLTVSGNAQIQVAPDMATVRLGIVRQAQTARLAQEQVNGVAQAILDAILKLGIPKEKVQTSRLTLSPVYAPRSPETRDAPRIVAYHASNIVTVTVETLTQVGPVIDAGLTAGANQLEGVSFSLKNDLPSRQQALKQAVMEARRKAETMAEALGVRLGMVLEISEGGVSVMPKGDFGGVMMAREMAAMAPTPVSPGELEVQANVSIRYRISPIQ